jgi:hypothetical protein
MDNMVTLWARCGGAWVVLLRRNFPSSEAAGIFWAVILEARI